MAINKEEVLEHAALIVKVPCLAHDGWDYAVHEIVRNVNGVRMKLLRKYPIGETRCALIVGIIAGHDTSLRTKLEEFKESFEQAAEAGLAR